MILLKEAKEESEEIDRKSVIITFPYQNYSTIKAGEDIIQAILQMTS